MIFWPCLHRLWTSQDKSYLLIFIVVVLLLSLFFFLHMKEKCGLASCFYLLIVILGMHKSFECSRNLVANIWVKIEFLNRKVNGQLFCINMWTCYLQNKVHFTQECQPVLYFRWKCNKYFIECEHEAKWLCSCSPNHPHKTRDTISWRLYFKHLYDANVVSMHSLWIIHANGNQVVIHSKGRKQGKKKKGLPCTR